MLAVIFIASLLPTEHIPKGNDKLHHLVSYAVLAWWCSLVFQTAQIKQHIKLALILIAFGSIIELLQGLSGYRYAELLDVLANTTGIIIGMFLAIKLTPRLIPTVEALIFKLKI